MLKKMSLLAVLIAILGAMLPLGTASAQTDGSVTITESQINSSYRVTNNPRRQVTNLSVDLQNGQAVVNGTLTFRRSDPINFSAVFVPSVSNGQISWGLTSVTVNGSAASQDVINAVSSAIGNSFRAWVRDRIRNGAGRRFTVTGITVSDSDIVITYTRP